MAVDLSGDEPLLAAMDSQTRRPLLEIISSPKTDDIPFDGQDLSKSVNKDISDPFALVHSTGRLVILGVTDYYAFSELPGIRFVYTDVDRLEFIQLDIPTGTEPDQLVRGVTCCELPDGKIGIIFLEQFEGNYRQYYLITSFDGVVYVEKTLIKKTEEFTGQWFSPPGLHKIADDDYLLVYARSVQVSSIGTVDLVKGTPDTITDSASKFVEDGFVAGQTMTLVNTSPNCDGDYEIASVSAGLITLTSNDQLDSQTKEANDSYRSNGYNFVKQTATDFTDWTDLVMLEGMGLDSLEKVSNPSFHEVGSELWMFFDKLDGIGPNDEELWSCYYSIYDGTVPDTWATPIKITGNTSYGDIATHPVAMMRTSISMEIVYTRTLSSLKMEAEFPPAWAGWDGASTHSFDPITSMLYVVNSNNFFGNIVKINIDTWEFIAQYDATAASGYAFPTWFLNANNGQTNMVHDGSDLAIFHTALEDMVLFHFDGTNEGDEISSYYFSDWQAPGSPKNINTDEIPELDFGLKYGIIASHVDKGNNRIYILMGNTVSSIHSVTFGYIDLTETIGIGTCSFHVLISDYRGFNPSELRVLTDQFLGKGGMHVDPVGGYVVFSGSLAVANVGFCVLFDLPTGLYLDSWRHPDAEPDGFGNAGTRKDFPVKGITIPFIYNDKIYAGLSSKVSLQPNLYGLVEIDIASSVRNIKTYRPDYCTDTNNAINRPSYYKDDKIIFTHGPNVEDTELGSFPRGVVAFDTVAKTWERWSNDSIPNLTKDNTDDGLTTPVSYDPTTGLIITGVAPDHGVIAFSESGYIKQSWFIHGDFDETWTWEEPARLIIHSLKNYDASVVLSPAGPYMYAFWQSGDIEDDDPEPLPGAGKAFLQWDTDGSVVDLSRYIINDEVMLSRTVSGNPSSISFTVSHGHLFDWNNVSSLLSIVLKKGRKLTVRWGERIIGEDHWSNAGEFFVNSINLAYKRGEYPVLRVGAEDQSIVWQFAHIPATTDFSDTPDQVLNTILQTYGGVDPSDINLGTVEGETTIYKQWLDTDIGTIVEQICNRYSQFLRWDIDGKATFKYITNTADVDNVYSDSTKIFNFTPDDKYSDFTNRVVVEGLNRIPTSVILPEERIEHLAGTLGWWGVTKEHRVWYSKDKTMGAVNPRMDVIETSNSIASYFQLGDSTYEELTEPGPEADLKYCIVEVVAEDLVQELIIAIGFAITGAVIGDAVQVNPISGQGWTISVGRVIQQAALTVCMLILGSTTQYQIDVYAQPMGKVRRRVQADWNDDEHQIEIGAIIPRKIEDDLCYSAHDCSFVVAHEGAVIQMQRNRVSFSKVADLRDEEGDTISIVHPYGLQVIKIYIVELHRKYKKASMPDGQGYFTDNIVGWVIL